MKLAKELKYGIAIIAVVAVLYLISVANAAPSKYDDFAKCVTSQGAVMYGTDWCPHCKNQKEMFGGSFKHINYVNCDLDQKACADAQVRGYPTWVINGKKYEGTQPLGIISAATNCPLESVN